MASLITRRNILRLAGGSALGIMFTPLPWRLLNDSAVWTQNWAMIPQLPRGPISYQHTSCTLCPAGCPMKARCVGKYPVSVYGDPGHPLSHGIVCPVGLASHHLAFHPDRISQPLKLEHGRLATARSPISLEQLLSEIVAFSKSGQTKKTVALLDQRPGRSVSRLYRHFARNVENGMYIVSPSRECRTATTLRSQFARDPGSLGFDFENASTVLSFGTPLLDGWGSPGRMLHIFGQRDASRPKLIQIESVQSRTALQSDLWIPITPGSEEILALGLGHIIVAEQLYHKDVVSNALDFQVYRDLVAKFTPSVVSARTGIREVELRELARTLTLGGPSIVIAGCDPGGGHLGKKAEQAIVAINLLLGNIARNGGIVLRNDDNRETAGTGPDTDLADVPDNSIEILIVDESQGAFSLPWNLVRRKLVRRRNLVIGLTTHGGGIGRYADFIVPLPAVFETLRDVWNSPDATVQTFSLAPPLFSHATAGIEQFDFITGLSRVFGITPFPFTTQQELFRHHAQVIFESGRGSMYSPVHATLASTSSAAGNEEIWNCLAQGGSWIDEKAEQRHPGKYHLLNKAVFMAESAPPELGRADAFPFLLVPFGWRGMLTAQEISPLTCKLYQESDLRNRAGCAFINSATASSVGCEHGDRAVVQTALGSMIVEVRVDETVMPGIIRTPVGPTRIDGRGRRQSDELDALLLCEVLNDGSWRSTPATMRKM